jgi:hypothetical protein
MRKQEKCQTFALDSGVPISKEMMVTTGTNHALNCGNMMLAWGEWNHCPLLDQRRWNNWKDHWTAAFAEMRDINRMTSGDSAIANQAAAQEIVQEEKMVALLDNLANAYIQKNDTTEKLVATNQQQAKIIANLTETIAKLKAGSPPTEQRSGCTNPPYWRSTKPAWDPTGYCWTHGFWVKVGHSSAT